MKPTIQSKPNALPAPRPIRAGLRVSQCFFKYPGSSRRDPRRDLNFHLQSGRAVALIGENGQGKTTIVKLITRLYDPTEGQILLDGMDLREYELEDLYREIGVIFQDFMRYEMTARENIAVGRIEELAQSVDHLQTAAQKSLADQVIAQACRGIRADARPPLRRRRRSFRRRMAENCAGPRLSARRADADPR